MVKWVSSLVLLAVSLLSAGECWAQSHFGPLIGFEMYGRRFPEATDSIRFTFGLSAAIETWKGWPMVELAALASQGVDSFASQNSIDERIFRFRLGTIVKPFRFEEPLVGLRFGGQYAVGSVHYNKRFPISTDSFTKYYWSPYVGVVVGVTPLAGFGVEEEFTATYDTFYKAWVYQLTFGIPL